MIVGKGDKAWVSIPFRAKIFERMTCSFRQNRAPFRCAAVAWPRTGQLTGPGWPV
jgi:hypothetical protein